MEYEAGSETAEVRNPFQPRIPQEQRRKKSVLQKLAGPRGDQGLPVSEATGAGCTLVSRLGFA